MTNVEEIDERTAMGETMMLGLRLLEDGVSAASFACRHGVSLFEQFGPQLSRLTDMGMLEVDRRAGAADKAWHLADKLGLRRVPSELEPLN